MRITALLFVVLFMLAVVPQKGEAQDCDEDCVTLVGSNGATRGFGCVSGGTMIRNCEATTTKCTGIICEQQTFLSYGSGVIVASVDLCPVAPQLILEVVAADVGEQTRLRARLIAAARNPMPTPVPGERSARVDVQLEPGS